LGESLENSENLNVKRVYVERWYRNII
jgi:hypothetical protein